MADFNMVETSRYGGRPVELYYFRYGKAPNEFAAYTNAEVPVSWDSVTYIPTPIDRDAIKASGTLDKSALGVRMPARQTIPELFRVYPPSYVVTLIIRQGHFIEGGTTEFLTCWAGRVTNCKFEGNQAELSGEPIQTSMRRTGLRESYQVPCPHALYGVRCRAQKQSFAASITAVDGTVVTLAEGWNTSGQPQAKFIGGMIEFDQGVNVIPRTILRVLAADVLLISGFVPGLRPESEIRMVLGCGHTLTDCETVHQNVLNYGGVFALPLDSPFGKNPFA